MEYHHSTKGRPRERHTFLDDGNGWGGDGVRATQLVLPP